MKLRLILLFLLLGVNKSNASFFDNVIGVNIKNNPSEKEVQEAFSFFQKINNNVIEVSDPRKYYYPALIIAMIDQPRLAAIAKKLEGKTTIDIFKEFAGQPYNDHLQGAQQIKEGVLEGKLQTMYQKLLVDTNLFAPSLHYYRGAHKLGAGMLIFPTPIQYSIPNIRTQRIIETRQISAEVLSVARKLLARGLPIIMVTGMIYLIYNYPQHSLVRRHLLPLIRQAGQNSLWALEELRRFCIQWYYRRR